MKYIDEYRNKDLVLQTAGEINRIVKNDLSLMEICGGHTTSIHKFGLKGLLSDKIRLLSGPGCPVCVTSIRYIDQIIAYSRLDNVIIAAFGDLMRVPGSTSTLERERSIGADIRVMYSSLEAIELAIKNKGKKIIFSGIGFETTAPTSAAAIQEAERNGIENFFVFSSHKVMPPAMEAIIEDGIKIDGYICPGHVSAVTGTKMYEPIVEKYKIGCVISGFEPVDLLQSIYILINQINSGTKEVYIQYKRAVKPEGNPKAKEALNKVFEYRDDYWRGLGVLPLSGLRIAKEYERFDAEKNFDVLVEDTIEPKGCICGEILKGLRSPEDCKLFANACQPANPVGACMVSGEGACAAYYKFRLV